MKVHHHFKNDFHRARKSKKPACKAFPVCTKINKVLKNSKKL